MTATAGGLQRLEHLRDELLDTARPAQRRRLRMRAADHPARIVLVRGLRHQHDTAVLPRDPQQRPILMGDDPPLQLGPGADQGVPDLLALEPIAEDLGTEPTTERGTTS